MVSHLLVTRPEHDYTTRYLSAWAVKYLDLARKKGYKYIDLERERACRKEFVSVLEKRAPELVVVNGHGNDTEIAGHDNEVLLTTSSEDVERIAGKIMYAISCRSARELGRVIASQENTAYVGYAEDFIFLYTPENSRKPLKDKRAATFLAPAGFVVIGLLKGHTVAESVTRAKDEFLKRARDLLTSQTSTEDAFAVRYLLWNMQHLTVQGDSSKDFVQH